MMRFLKAFLAAQDGATAVEYGLIIALIGMSIVGGLTAISNGINGKFTTVADTLANKLLHAPSERLGVCGGIGA